MMNLHVIFLCVFVVLLLYSHIDFVVFYIDRISCAMCKIFIKWALLIGINWIYSV